MNAMSESELTERVCEELRRLATNGVAPSAQRYDQQRDRALPASWRITRATGLYWDEIVELAGLRLSARSAAVRRSMIKNASVPAAVERDIERTMRANRALGVERYTDGLTALDSSRRVREFTVQMPDGSVRRIVQESVSLR